MIPTIKALIGFDQIVKCDGILNWLGIYYHIRRYPQVQALRKNRFPACLAYDDKHHCRMA
jgi:hypothetical protein